MGVSRDAFANTCILKAEHAHFAREIVKKHMMPPFQEGFEIIYEDLGNDSSLLGAAALAFDSFG